MTRRLLGALLIVGALLLVGAACGGEPSTTTIIVRQDAPAISVVDFLDASGAADPSGDFLPFRARITVDGRPGVLIGLLTVLDVPVERRGVDVDLDQRIGTLVFDLGRGDQIMALGGAVYPAGATQMRARAPQVRAVIGGTGDHLGARGQITTTRNPDGSYTHRIELVD